MFLAGFFTEEQIEKAWAVLVPMKAEWPSFAIGFTKCNGVKITAEKCPFFASFLWANKETKEKLKYIMEQYFIVK